MGGAMDRLENILLGIVASILGAAIYQFLQQFISHFGN
jgi:uncharacterized membrane protein YeaQ/YmgE (transglycosylase-associated protein family)